MNQHGNEIQALTLKINKARRNLKEGTREWKEKTGSPYIDYALRLENKHLDGCVLLPDRLELLNLLPKKALCCEVGTDQGIFARQIIKSCFPKELVIVDISFERFEYDKFREVDVQGVAKTYEMDSVECLSSFPERYFDWIYIDGDHSYEGAKRDLNVAMNKVKDEGYIVCNDYTTWSVSSMTKCGVARAVNEFCLNFNWKFVYFALQGNMYYDVAMKRLYQ
jgi:predicted O-methyltransferase YrrM